MNLLPGFSYKSLYVHGHFKDYALWNHMYFILIIKIINSHTELGLPVLEPTTSQYSQSTFHPRQLLVGQFAGWSCRGWTCYWAKPLFMQLVLYINCVYNFQGYVCFQGVTRVFAGLSGFVLSPVISTGMH